MSSAGKAPKRWLCCPLPGPPRAVVAQGCWVAPHTLQALWPHPHTAPLPHLQKSPFGLLRPIVQSITVTVEKKEKQTAGAAISLSHQSIINSSPFSAQPLGRGSHVAGIETFHADAAEATAGQALPTPTQHQLCAVPAGRPLCEHSPAQSSPGATRCHRCQPSLKNTASRG